MKATLLKREAWEPELGFYARSMDTVRGPAFNVRLHSVHDHISKLECAFDFDMPEHFDAQGWIQHDVARSEFEWFQGWIGEPGYSEPGLLDFAGPLDQGRFELAGRSGGWLVYDISDRADDYLTADEYEALKRLDEVLPSMVDGVAQTIAVELFCRALADSREAELTERLAASRDSVIEYVKKGQYDLAQTEIARLEDIERSIAQNTYYENYLDEAWAILEKGSK